MQSSRSNWFRDLELQRIEYVAAPVDRGEVLRYLGYPAGVEPSPRVRAGLDRWITEAARRAESRAVYVVLPVVQKSERTLRLATQTSDVEFRGAIGEFLGVAEWIAAFIATAGPAVEALAGDLMSQGNVLAGYIVNAVGAERAEAAESAVIDRLRDQAAVVQFAPTLPYSPGYCGMALAEQSTLFALFGAETVGVSLSSDFLMQPLKSVTGLIGLGPATAVQQYGSPCDRCELYTCAMRR